MRKRKKNCFISKIYKKIKEKKNQRKDISFPSLFEQDIEEN